jgi:hypothetical protein
MEQPEEFTDPLADFERWCQANGYDDLPSYHPAVVFFRPEWKAEYQAALTDYTAFRDAEALTQVLPGLV